MLTLRIENDRQISLIERLLRYEQKRLIDELSTDNCNPELLDLVTETLEALYKNNVI